MYRIKSLIFLLIVLLLTQSIFQGCTMMGYTAGKKRDVRHAKKIDTDIADIQKGDFVEIRLKDDSRIRGRILAIQHQKEVRIKYIGANFTDKDFVKTKTFQWDEIHGVKFIEVGISRRVKGAILGFFLDLIPIVLIIIGESMKGISAMA